jgi:hypothetical protein
LIGSFALDRLHPREHMELNMKLTALSTPQPQNARVSDHSERPLAVTIESTRKLTSLGNTTVWALIKEGRLKTIKIGRRTLVLFDSIERLLTPQT